MVSVAVTTPVIESASSDQVAKAGSVTGGVLLVTTSAGYVVSPISFVRISENVVFELFGGLTVIVPDAAILYEKAHVSVAPSITTLVALVDSQVRSTGSLLGILPEDGDSNPVGR